MRTILNVTLLYLTKFYLMVHTDCMHYEVHFIVHLEAFHLIKKRRILKDLIMYN